MSPASAYRRVRTFVSLLLAYLMLLMPLAPVSAQVAKVKRTPAAQSAQQTDKSGKGKGSDKQVTLPSFSTPLSVSTAPVITATKDDGRTLAQGAVAGDTINYTVVITNTGTADATGVTFNDTIDPNTTLVPSSIQTQPVTQPDSYTASGNIPISLAAPGVLTNDNDPDGDTLTVTEVGPNVGTLSAANVGVATNTNSAGLNGTKGSVTLSSNGGFTYEPPPGFDGTDTFSYQVSDGTYTDTNTVTITITGMVWFIDNSASSSSNQGTFSNPFKTIHDFDLANTGTALHPKANDYIALRKGTGTYAEADGIDLLSGQILIGEAVRFDTVFTANANSSSAYTTFAAGTNTAPKITASAGNGVDLSTSNTVRGLDVGDTSGFKINGNAVGSPTINTINLTGTGGAINVATSGAFGSNVTFNTLESTSSATWNIQLTAVTGTLGVTSGGTGLSDTSGNENILINGGSVSMSYPGNVTKSSGLSSLVKVTNAHTGTLTFTGTLNASSGDGLQFNNADGTYNFNGTTTLNGGDAGVDILNDSGGTFSFNGNTTITNPTGTAFNVGTTPGSPTVTYAGTITQNTSGQFVVNVDSTSGGSVSFTDSTNGLTGGASSKGININAANGNVSFAKLTLGTSGARMTNQPVTITGGTGTYSLGVVSIFTNNVLGIGSTNADGTLNSTSGTVDSTGATAINLDGPAGLTTLGMTLTTVNSTGGTNNVALADVGGSITINGGALTGASGSSFLVGAGSANVTYNGTITNNTARVVDVQGKTAGGTVAFGGAISSSGGTGVFLNNNSTAIINFTGGLALTTNANAAFTATGGGTVSATQNNTSIINTLVTTTGTALNVANTNIGASGLTFRSINVTGNNTNPANGIILNTTGASGGLTVSGNGGSCTPALSTCTGGTIQGTGSYGISLTTTASVALNLVSIHNTGNRAINGDGVNGFILRDSRIFNFDNGTHPSGATVDAMHFESSNTANTLAGHGLTGTVIIQRDTIGPDGTFTLTPFPTLPENDGIVIRNHSDANLSMTVTGTTFTQLSNDGIDAEVTNGPATINVDGSTADGANVFSQINGRAVNFGDPADNTTAQTLDLTVKNNTFDKVGIGGRWFASARATMNARYNNNTMTNTTNDAIRAESDATNQALTPHATVNATVTNNSMGGGSAFISAHRSALINMALNSNTGFGGTAAGVGGSGSTGVHTGINLRSDRGSTLNIDVLSNTGTADGSAAQSQAALDMQVTDNGGGPSTICANVKSNTFTESPDAGEQVISIDPVGGTITIEGGPGGSPGTENYLIANNTLNGTNKVAISDPSKVPSGVGVNCVSSTPQAPPPGDINPAPASSARATDTSVPSNDITSHPFVSLPQVAVTGVKPAKGEAQALASAQLVAPQQTQQATATKSVGGSSKSAKPTTHVINATQAGSFPLNIGTLAPNDSVTIHFSVTVNGGNFNTVSNQGSVTGTNFTVVNGKTGTPNTNDTENPGAPGSPNPTVTNIIPPPAISVHDAKVTEPTTGTVSMPFTVTLNHAYPNAVSFDFTTVDGSATGGTCGTSGIDYATTSGLAVTFAPGQLIKVVNVPVCADNGDNTEADETFQLSISNPTASATLGTTPATGTITHTNTPGTLMISEFRQSGPGGGTDSANDDFVELFNNTASSIDISGYGLFKSGATCSDAPVLVGTVPGALGSNTKVIPARGHFLFVGSSYSLANYGGTGAAGGDATLTADIENDRNLALFPTANPSDISSVNRLDAVGFQSNANTLDSCDLLREGTNLTTTSGAGSNSEYSLVRKLTTGTPQDTNDNAADFMLVSTTPNQNVGGNTPILGAPGPENLASPVNSNDTVKARLIDATQSSSASPNRVRNSTPYTDTATPSSPTGVAPGVTPYSLGTLVIRRRFTNNTTGTLTRLRFRIVDMTTSPSPLGTADLRAITTPTATVTVQSSDPTVCGANPLPCNVVVKGTTIEQAAPNQRPWGGGLNSTYTVAIVSIPPGGTVDVQFLFGVAQSGGFRFFVNVESK